MHLLLLLLQVQLNCIRYDFVFMKCINYFSSHVLEASSGLQTPNSDAVVDAVAPVAAATAAAVDADATSQRRSQECS